MILSSFLMLFENEKNQLNTHARNVTFIATQI